MPNIIFQLTEDGSHTLYVPALDEHYHSVHGAIQESRFVFLKTGLEACHVVEPSIFEVGFGTGLNAFLTAIEATEKQRAMRYTTVELYPLNNEQVAQLNYVGKLGYPELFADIHAAKWDEWQEIIPNFRLKKIEGDCSSLKLLENEYDLIFFDAFAPNKQGDLWQQVIFDNLFRSLKPDGIFVTYCAKGVVRRMLQSSGFLVERLPGPPGKHEMLRGRKPLY
jgi:tRNA U34 5-methylaminomethyl-2-thiouridine-forming methyltransferase MnmC